MIGRVVVTGPDGVRVPVRSGQVAAVLALLWDERRPVRRDEVAELLWGTDHFPEHWAGAVRGVVAKARTVLERAGMPPGALRAESGLIELSVPEGSTTDVDRARDLLTAAESAAAGGDLEGAEQLACRTLEIVDRPLAITGEGDWIRHLHDRVAGCAQRARQLAAEALLGLERYVDAVAACDKAIVADPFDEVAHGLLIRAQLAAGRPAAARRAYDELVRILHTELGVEPSAEVTGLLAANRPAATSSRPDDRLTGFRGRGAEREVLQRCLDETVESQRPTLVLIDGPSGIGKTRLARVFAETSGVPFGWGRCHRNAGVPFEPFVDMIRARLADDTAGVLPPDARAALERLRLDGPIDHPRGSLGDDRAVVLRDLVAEIAAWADGSALVLVLDDLQWASGDTIALLQQVLEDAEAPILVVATVRGRVADPLAVAELVRAAPATVVSLGGITAAELVPLAAELTDEAEPGDDSWSLARTLHARTGGLAYYIDELVRAHRRGGRFDPDDIPASVRTWISHRIDALPAVQVELLEAAAVIGGEGHLSLGLVEAVVASDSVDVGAGLDALAREGLLRDGDSGGTFRFAHEITREVVTERIGAARLAQLHLDAARALSDRDDPPHAALAGHFAAAGPEHFGTSAQHGYQAAAASLSRGAWDLAETQATASLDRCPAPAFLLRTGLLCVRGSARHALGRAGNAVDDLDEAIALATEHRFPQLLARATLRMVGRAGRGADPGMADDRRADLLRHALEATRTWAVPDATPDAPGFVLDAASLAELRTAVEVELAWATLFDGRFAERRALLTGSLDRARREHAGPARLARILVAQRNILQGPGDLPERLAKTDESLALPTAQIAPETRIAAHLGRGEDLLALGDRDGAAAALATAARLVERHGHPYWRWAVATWESLMLLVAGDPAAAEAALAEASTIQPMASPEAAACSAVQTVAIRLAQDRAGEVVDVLAASAAAHPEIPCYRAVLALCRSRSGDPGGAECVYGEFARDDFASIPTDSNRLLSVAVLGDVAADLGDADGAATLHRLLGPDADLDVVLNCYGGGGAWWGPVTRIRERLEAVGRSAHGRASVT